MPVTPRIVSPEDFISVEKIETNIIPNINILNQSYQKAVEVHEILLKSEDLTNNQKLDFCSVGRYFMKQYLKDIVKKIT